MYVLSACLSPLELMDMSSRAEVKSAKGHTSQVRSSTLLMFLAA